MTDSVNLHWCASQDGNGCGDRMMPAFDTATGIPIGNKLEPVCLMETSTASTAGGGSLYLDSEC